MNIFKKALSGILLFLFEAAAGVLLLVDATMFTSAIFIALGVALILWGISGAVKYFRTEKEVGAEGQLLFKALVAAAAGLFCVFRFEWFATVFPMLTALYGVVILVVGLYKVQTTVDSLRYGEKRWFLKAIGALLSIVCRCCDI